MSWKRVVAVVGAATALAACGGGSGKGNLTVSAKSATPANTPASGSATQSSLDLGNGVSIDTIKVVVRKIELEGPSASCTPMTPPATPSTPPAPGMKDGGGDGGGSGGGGDDPPGHDQGDDDEECEIQAGPFLVSLSGSDLVNGIHPVFDTSIPTGTFDEISVRIDTINAEQAAKAPVESQRADLADMAARNVSLEITGTRNAQPFDLAVAIDVRIKREGTFTISPDAVANMTFTLDPSTWFGPTGATLDPSTQGAQIVQNILSSLHLVRDDDHDGRDDQNDDHGNDGPGHG